MRKNVGKLSNRGAALELSGWNMRAAMMPVCLLVGAACAPGDAIHPDVEFTQSLRYSQTIAGQAAAAGQVAPMAGVGVAPMAGAGVAPMAGVGVAPVAGEPPGPGQAGVAAPVAGQGTAGQVAAPLDAGRQDAGTQSNVDSGAVGTPDAGVDSGPPVMQGPRPTKLVLEFTTQPIQGMWGPVNVGAAWVEDASGKWVHTLEYWTGILNVRHIAEYAPHVSSGAPGPVFLAFPAPVDTVGRATLQVHETHRLSWGLHDASGNDIPDGMYKLFIEFTEEENDPGEILIVDFEKGASPMSLSPTSNPAFTGVLVSLE